MNIMLEIFLPNVLLHLYIIFVLFYFFRIKNRLESLTTSLIAWKQFENGLNEFKEVLGKDTGALKRLTGALEMGTDEIGNNLAYDVKEVAKRLSEKMDSHNSVAATAAAVAAAASAQQVKSFPNDYSVLNQ